MPSLDRQAAGRRRTWGRGPISLKLESLERRALMAAQASSPLPDLVNSSLTVSTNVSDWGGAIEVEGQVTNQGTAPTTAPTEVAIYASPVRGIDKYSVAIGEATIPAGLAPGASVPYQTPVNLPTAPVSNVSSTGGTLYITAWVNPNQTVAESNYRNNKDLGPPHDSTGVYIEAPKPADLVGTTFAVTPTDPNWGDTITVTAQITNQGSGASPQTTALLSLTPSGLNYGNSTTVGIGTITVPPLSPYQTINLVQQVTLPAVEPLSITNYTNFGLTMTQDADYLTNSLYPSEPTQGVGYDQTPMTITTSSTSTATAGPLPDLAATSIMGPTGTIRWGQSFQINTDVQNLGLGAAGAFQVFYVLTGQTGSISDAIYLGQTVVNGLAAGASQSISQTLTLPSRLPAGVTLGSVGYARVAEIVDPDNFINETLKSNNESISAPFIVRLPGNTTTVPTDAAAGGLPSVASVAAKDQAAVNAANAAKADAKLDAIVAARRAKHPRVAKLVKSKKLERKQPPKTDSLVDKAISLGTEITKLPHQAISAISKSI
jgi:hypothetical protein